MFFEQFGNYMRFGLHVNLIHPAKNAEMLLFSDSTSGKERIGLKEYVTRMNQWQKNRYCIPEKCNKMWAGQDGAQDIGEN